jgi:hypothetical protein
MSVWMTNRLPTAIRNLKVVVQNEFKVPGKLEQAWVSTPSSKRLFSM